MGALAKIQSYAAFLRVEGRLCVVIGGGPVALRKVRKLWEAGAQVRVISPTLVDELNAAAVRGTLEYWNRPYSAGDTDGAFLTFAATNDRQVNRAVAQEVHARGGLVNVADDPSLCTFTVPASWSSDGLAVAISTGGEDPRAAKRLRQALEQDVQDQGGRFVAAVKAFLRR